MKEIFTAATVEEAKAKAAESFGVSADKITFNVLEEVKKGLFRKPSAKVEAVYDYPEPVKAEGADDVPPIRVMVTEDDRKAAKSAPEKKKEIPVKPETAAEKPVTKEPAPALVKEKTPEPTTTKLSDLVGGTPVPKAAPKEEAKVSRPAPAEAEKPQQPAKIPAKEVKEAKPAPAENADPKPAKSKDPAFEQKTKAAVDYIVNVLEKMGLENVSAVPSEADGGIIIELSADGLNEMIGKKGELLDALQYLSSLVCNKIDREYFRITTDSCGFRAKRKAQLERLAHKIANNVKKNGRTHSLEPMNPYERRIIHAAVSEIEGVTSKSVGEEPFRKVVISSTEKRQGGYNNKKGGRRNNSNGGGNRRGGERNRRPPKQPHFDITTDFERNYKKPKPEDDMDLGSGVYGKIEF